MQSIHVWAIQYTVHQNQTNPAVGVWGLIYVLICVIILSNVEILFNHCITSKKLLLTIHRKGVNKGTKFNINCIRFIFLFFFQYLFYQKWEYQLSSFASNLEGCFKIFNPASPLIFRYMPWPYGTAIWLPAGIMCITHSLCGFHTFFKKIITFPEGVQKVFKKKKNYIHYSKKLKEHDQHHLWYVDTLRSSC